MDVGLECITKTKSGLMTVLKQKSKNVDVCSTQHTAKQTSCSGQIHVPRNSSYSTGSVNAALDGNMNKSPFEQANADDENYINRRLHCSGSTNQNGINNNNKPSIDDIRDHLWYHGSIGRSQAEALLQDGHCGQFLVRDCISRAGNYVLTCNADGSVLHFMINRSVITSGRAVYHFEDDQYQSVPDLIRAYVGQKKPITEESRCIISIPVNRLLPTSPCKSIEKLKEGLIRKSDHCRKEETIQGEKLIVDDDREQGNYVRMRNGLKTEMNGTALSGRTSISAEGIANLKIPKVPESIRNRPLPPVPTNLPNQERRAGTLRKRIMLKEARRHQLNKWRSESALEDHQGQDCEKTTTTAILPQEPQNLLHGSTSLQSLNKSTDSCKFNNPVTTHGGCIIAPEKPKRAPSLKGGKTMLVIKDTKSGQFREIAPTTELTNEPDYVEEDEECDYHEYCDIDYDQLPDSKGKTCGREYSRLRPAGISKDAGRHSLNQRDDEKLSLSPRNDEKLSLNARNDENSSLISRHPGPSSSISKDPELPSLISRGSGTISNGARTISHDSGIISSAAETVSRSTDIISNGIESSPSIPNGTNQSPLISKNAQASISKGNDPRPSISRDTAQPPPLPPRPKPGFSLVQDRDSACVPDMIIYDKPSDLCKPIRSQCKPESLYTSPAATARPLVAERPALSRISAAFFTSSILEANVKPLCKRAWYQIRTFLLATDASVLARVLTQEDAAYLNLSADDHSMEHSFPSLLLLPHGDAYRRDLLERITCMQFFVSSTILQEQDGNERVKILAKWIDTAYATMNQYANEFAFGNIMDALGSPQVSGIASCWRKLREEFPDEVQTYETTLKTRYYSLYHCLDKSMNGDVCLPHLEPIVRLLSAESIDEIDCGDEIRDDEYGLDRLWRHLEQARQLPLLFDQWRRNSLAQIGSNIEAANCTLHDLFRTEFHLRYLFGAKGSTVPAKIRYMTFQRILTAMASNIVS